MWRSESDRRGSQWWILWWGNPDPTIHKCGWTEDMTRREETAGSIEIIGGKARRRSRGRVDHTLFLKTAQAIHAIVGQFEQEGRPPRHGRKLGREDCRGTRRAAGVVPCPLRPRRLVWTKRRIVASYRTGRWKIVPEGGKLMLGSESLAAIHADYPKD